MSYVRARVLSSLAMSLQTENTSMCQEGNVRTAQVPGHGQPEESGAAEFPRSAASSQDMTAARERERMRECLCVGGERERPPRRRAGTKSQSVKPPTTNE